MLARRTVLMGLPAGLVLAAGLGPRGVLAAEPPVYAEGGVAIDGTDPTSYFTTGRPVPGEEGITLVWQGATWRFASAEARARFESDPTAYAPQFGGYCAWAVAEGYLASSVPDAWKIVDGALYLNFSRRIQRRWERDIAGNIARGRANWPGVLAG